MNNVFQNCIHPLILTLTIKDLAFSIKNLWMIHQILCKCKNRTYCRVIRHSVQRSWVVNVLGALLVSVALSKIHKQNIIKNSKQINVRVDSILSTRHHPVKQKIQNEQQYALDLHVSSIICSNGHRNFHFIGV
jgi:hypothetical protein